ncbi:hypothetical protein [[Kitasatospora] papulosa]|uniref:hypothetical protein n=1 Tax=[Kitasatospora] papulosa TaxID=1464011 RepID=UPI0036ADE415
MSVRDEVMAWLRGPHPRAVGVRDEVMAPLRGLHPRNLIAGSWVLAGLLLQLLARAIRAGLALYRSGGQEEPEAKPVPARKKVPASLRKKKGKGAAKAQAAPEGEDQEDADAEGEEQTDEAEDAEKAKPKPKPKGKATTAADSLEKLAINGLGIVVALVVLATAAGPLRDATARLIGPYLPIITAVLVVAWIIAAAMLAPDPKAIPEEREHDKNISVGEWSELTPEQEAAARDAAAGRALLRYVITCVRAAVQEGRKGIHIATMLEGMPGNADVSLFRAECDRYKIPTRKLQIRNVGNTWGVRADDLEAALGASLDDALEALTSGPDSLVDEGQQGAPVEAPVEGPAYPSVGTPVPVPTGPPPHPPVEAPAQPPSEAPDEEAGGAAPRAPLARLIEA